MSFFRTAFPLFLVFLFLSGTACEQNADFASDPDTFSRLDSVSYSLGYFYGTSMANEGIDEFNYRNFAAGLRAGVERRDSHIDEWEMQMALQNYQMDLQQAQQDRSQSTRQEADRFLVENAERDEVMVTDSGLQYRVIEEGDGRRPEENSTVRVHYHGTLINGEEFDSSHRHGDDPVEFPLNRVIPGWTEGLQLMEEGATYEFFIPADLAYGDNPPQGSPITPGATLIFEVQLIAVVD